MEASAPEKITCYRHKDRETRVACSSCGRPICPDCMTPTPVGMRCPECSRQKTKVRTARTLTGSPQLTYGLIVVCVIVYVATVITGGNLDARSGWIYEHGALYSGYVAGGDWWRIVTNGFMHSGPFHLLMNMYSLYFLGTLLEPMIGKLRFALIYAVSLFGGSFAVVAFSPNSISVGASTAIFGLLGAAILALRSRGIDPMQSGLGAVLLINLAITFLYSGQISVAGHLGGLAAGLVAGFLMFEVAARRRSAQQPVLLVCAGMAVALAVAAVLVA